MKFNLNDMMRGRLSETGARILNERDRRLVAEYPRLAPGYTASRKAGDTYECQIWQMMDFGDAMVLDGMLPFIAGEIEIVTPEVRRHDAATALKRRMYRV